MRWRELRTVEGNKGESEMKRILLIFLLLTATAVWAIPGDLNLDGVVDFEDFFLFADNFGKEGPPDTLRVVVTDTIFVQVYDTTRVTFWDTVVVADPSPGLYTPQRQMSLIDTSDPLEGMRVDSVKHFEAEFRLGTGLERETHQLIQVSYFEANQIITKVYLKPSGHLVEKKTVSYEVEVVNQTEGHVEFWFEPASGFLYDDNSVRYLYDADMNQVGSTEGGLAESITGDYFWLAGRRIFILDLDENGYWEVNYSKDEFAPLGSTWGPIERVTFVPVDFEQELQK